MFTLPHRSSCETDIYPLIRMNANTTAAWVAFIVATLALLIALAQDAQQYVATGHSMRKCDKSVCGPMPGQSGRRIWI